MGPRGEQDRPHDVQSSGISAGTGAKSAGRWLRTDGGGANYDAITGDRIGASTVIVQVVRQDVLPGELDPGGFPRRYQYLVDSGVGKLYVDGQGYDVRWERKAIPKDLTTWTSASTGGPVVPPAGQGVVGDRAAGQRDRRGLTA